MITKISYHAQKRLFQRRGCVHLQRHLNKMNKWPLPDDGDTLHKGYRYITRGGVLVTVIPDRTFLKNLKKERANAKY